MLGITDKSTGKMLVHFATDVAFRWKAQLRKLGIGDLVVGLPPLWCERKGTGQNTEDASTEMPKAVGKWGWYPLPNWLGILGSVVSSHGGVWGKAPENLAF